MFLITCFLVNDELEHCTLTEAVTRICFATHIISTWLHLRSKTDACNCFRQRQLQLQNICVFFNFIIPNFF